MIIFECAKTITHEMRHLFQMFWAGLMNDDLARRWKEAFNNPISSENDNIISGIEAATKYAR